MGSYVSTDPNSSDEERQQEKLAQQREQVNADAQGTAPAGSKAGMHTAEIQRAEQESDGQGQQDGQSGGAEQELPERPAGNASRDEWHEYATQVSDRHAKVTGRPYAGDSLDGMTRTDLQKLAERHEREINQHRGGSLS